jgi:hypothetical protein
MKTILIILFALVCSVVNPVSLTAQQTTEKSKSEDVSIKSKLKTKEVEKEQDTRIQAKKEINKEVSKTKSTSKQYPESSANETKSKTVKIGDDQKVTVGNEKVKKESREMTETSEKEYQKGHEYDKNKDESINPQLGYAKSEAVKRRIESSQKEIKSANSSLKQAEGKIAYVRKKTQEAFNEKNISEEEYKARMAKLDAYEKQMLKLENENIEISNEILYKIEEKEAGVEEAYIQKKISEEEYKAKKKELEEIRLDNKKEFKNKPTS